MKTYPALGLNQVVAFVVALFVFVCPAHGQGSSSRASSSLPINGQAELTKADEQLAQDLHNPIADLIQVPIVSTFDFGLDAGNGFGYTLTLQPVIPIKINNNWNLITRPIFTVVDSPESDMPGQRTRGIGDLTAQFYFSPEKAAPFVWGFGPVLGMPMASHALLGTGKWTLGPGLAVIKQTEHWSVGALANHVWSFAGDATRAGVSLTSIEPAVSYSWGKDWSVGLDAASTYDVNAPAGSKWVEPVEISISKVKNFGSRPVGLTFGVIPYAIAPAGYPSVGFDFTITPLFPKK